MKNAIKILVVDDETNQVDTICRGLKLYGYECKGATGVDQATRAIKVIRDLNLLIIDLSAPGHSAITVIEAARKRYPDLPILAIAGLAESEEADGIPSSGIALLRKPFDPQTLAESIRRHLGHRETLQK